MKSTSIKAAMARLPPTPSNTGPHTSGSCVPRGVRVLLLSEPALFVAKMGVAVGVVDAESTGVTVSVGVGEGVACGDGLLVGVTVAVLMVILMGVCARSPPVA